MNLLWHWHLICSTLILIELSYRLVHSLNFTLQEKAHSNCKDGYCGTLTISETETRFCSNLGILKSKLYSINAHGLCIILWEKPKCRGRSTMISPEGKCNSDLETCPPIDISGNWSDKISSLSDCNFGDGEPYSTVINSLHKMPICDNICPRKSGIDSPDIINRKIKKCCNDAGYDDGGHCAMDYAQCITLHWTITDATKIVENKNPPFKDDSVTTPTVWNTEKTEQYIDNKDSVGWGSSYILIIVLVLVAAGVFFGGFLYYKNCCSEKSCFGFKASSKDSGQVNNSLFDEEHNEIENQNPLQPSWPAWLNNQIPRHSQVSSDTDPIYTPINYDQVKIQINRELNEYDHLDHCQISSNPLPEYARFVRQNN